MFYPLLRRALFTLEPERAHAWTLTALRNARRFGLIGMPRDAALPHPIEIMGLRFPNRIGLAAGFDKDGCAIDALAALGFGHIEIGTITPLPQPGQDRPRVFRLPAQRGLINRMGFPNAGALAVAERLSRRPRGVICGVNIGKNAATPLEHALDDYVRCFTLLAPHADYVAVNVSSPNTEGLRRLQSVELLEPILVALMERRDELAARTKHRVPLLVKISPDMAPDELSSLTEVVLRLPIDGVIATNTTVKRPASIAADERTGGMSGEPLRVLSLATVARLRALLGQRTAIIGVGGIGSVTDARAMLHAGADLLQIYTGLVYGGPSLVRTLVRGTAGE